MAKVTVWLPYHHLVAYEVEVHDPDDLEEIRKALREKSPGDWKREPAFYEALGDSYQDSVEEITEENVAAEDTNTCEPCEPILPDMRGNTPARRNR